MKVILMRHGETEENKRRTFLGMTDSPLCPDGEAQARRAGAMLPQVEHVYVSPLRRCRQTAEILWPGVPCTVIPDLRETDFGPFEGKTHEELSGNPLYEEWLQDPEDPKIACFVESPRAAGARAAAAWGQIVGDAWCHDYESIGVVSHGGTLMSILSQYSQPRRSYYAWRFEPCQGYAGEVETDRTFTLRGRVTAEDREV